MGCEPDAHELGPAALLRAAAFPLDRLAVLGDPALARLAQQSGGGPPDGALVEAHAAAVTRERLLLREATAGDPAFMKALVLANPQLARAAAAPPDRRRKKAEARSRRLHGALYRHLSRAVGRTEPADLWAGVALVRWGGETTVEEEPATMLVQPDLRPFQAMLRSLATRRGYLWSEAWRANATLYRGADRSWRYTARLRDGRLVDRVLQPNPTVDLVVPLLPDRAHTLGELASRLAGPLGVGQEAMGAQLEAFVDAGLLVGGLDLPSRFLTPWEALERAGARLHGADGDAWCSAVRALRGCADDLEARLASASPDEVARLVDRAECLVADLAARLAVDTGPTRAVLRCDLGLGVRLTLGPDVRGRLAAELGRRGGLSGTAAGVGLRARLAAGVRDQVGQECGLAEAALRFRSPRTGDPAPRQTVGEPGSPAEGSIGQSPFACLMTGLEQGPGTPSLRVRGIFDEVAPLYGRFAPLWSDGAPGPLDPLHPWLRDGLARIAEHCRLRVAELAGPCEVNPNALAAPSFTEDVVELWGTTESGDGLAGAQLCTDAATGSLVVRMPGGADAVLLSFSSADLARGDRTSELLLATSGRLAPAPSFEASAVVSTESQPGELPRAETAPAEDRLPDRPEPTVEAAEGRTVLDADTVDGLRSRTGVGLYRRWQQLAATHAWPDTVRVRASSGEPPLLVRTTSPVAVEAVLARLGSDITHLVVEDAGRTPWLADRAGSRYVCELVVPFRRARHLWSHRAEVDEP